MPRQLGPFDRRLAIKRCLPCTQAHAKCDGKTPCNQCFSSGRSCVPSLRDTRQIRLRFSHVQTANQQIKCETIAFNPTSSWTDRCITHFFASFLQRHDFTGQSCEVYQDLQDLIHSSQSLRYAVLAISTLDIKSHHRSNNQLNGESALQHYHNAVVSLRKQVNGASPDTGADDQLLWSTLLLGIFELLYDSTGDGFLLHFIQGTTVLLRSKAPSCYLQSGGSQFLRVVRMFEMTRAVVFWSDSFLLDAEWQEATNQLASNDEENYANKGGMAFEGIYKLVGQVVKLVTNTIAIVKCTSEDELTAEQMRSLKNLTLEGFGIRQSLQSWHSTLLRHFSNAALNPVRGFNLGSDIDIVHLVGEEIDDATSRHHPWITRPRMNAQLLLSQIYYHAVSLNIVSVFKVPHFPHLNLSVPSHSPAMVQKHVICMLTLTECALEHTTLAGVLLLWPLRAAGARAIDVDQVAKVKTMLADIERRGFVVARAIEELCMRQWWKPKGLA